MRSTSPPGSMTAASFVFSHQKRVQFCAKAVTGITRKGIVQYSRNRWTIKRKAIRQSAFHEAFVEMERPDLRVGFRRYGADATRAPLIDRSLTATDRRYQSDDPAQQRRRHRPSCIRLRHRGRYSRANSNMSDSRALHRSLQGIRASMPLRASLPDRRIRREHRADRIRVRGHA